MNTSEAMNLRIIAKTMIWKKFSPKFFSKKAFKRLIRKEVIAIKATISQILE